MPALKCPHCSRVLKVKETAAGKQIACPACHKKFLAPRPPGAAPSPPAPPPVGSADRPWHVHVDGRNVGPYAATAIIDQLKAGKIDRNTLAWREGMDDWKALKEVEDFRKACRGSRPGGKPDEEGEPERRRHYAPGKSKRDAVVGAWVAVGLAVVLIIVILYVANRPTPSEATDPYERLRSAVTAGPPLTPAVAPTPGVTSAGTPTRKPPKIIRKPKPKLTNEKLLAKAVNEIDAAFIKAFADPGKADYKQLFNLQKKCVKHAAELKARDWGSYKRDVERYAGILEQTAQGIQSQIRDISQKWSMGREGLDEKIIAKDYPKDIAFVKNWESAVNEAKAKMAERGLNIDPPQLRQLPSPPEAIKRSPPTPTPKPAEGARAGEWQHDVDVFLQHFDKAVRQSPKHADVSSRNQFYAGKRVRWKLVFKRIKATKKGEEIEFELETHGILVKAFSSKWHVWLTFSPDPSAVPVWKAFRPGSIVEFEGVIKDTIFFQLGGRNWGMASVTRLKPLRD